MLCWKITKGTAWPATLYNTYMLVLPFLHGDHVAAKSVFDYSFFFLTNLRIWAKQNTLELRLIGDEAYTFILPLTTLISV